jgi:hypothetical protein
MSWAIYTERLVFSFNTPKSISEHQEVGLISPSALQCGNKNA